MRRPRDLGGPAWLEHERYDEDAGAILFEAHLGELSADFDTGPGWPEARPTD